MNLTARMGVIPPIKEVFMPTMQAATQEFLAQRRIAVAGVSCDGKGPGNLIYRKLRQEGYEVSAANPKAR